MSLPNSSLQYISIYDAVIGTADPSTPNGALNRELYKLLQNDNWLAAAVDSFLGTTVNYLGPIAAAALPVSAVDKGFYVITVEGTKYGIDWEVGDGAFYDLASTSWKRLKGAATDAANAALSAAAASVSAAEALASKNSAETFKNQAGSFATAAAASAATAASFSPKIEVLNIAALKALSTTSFTSGDVALVRGRFFANDNLGGFYQWNPSGVYADNSATFNTIIAPTIGGGNWQFVGSLSTNEYLRRPRQLKAWQKIQANRKGVTSQLRVMAFGDSVAQRQIGKLLPLVRKNLGNCGAVGTGAISSVLSGGASTSDDYTVSPVGFVTSVPAGGNALLSQSGGSFYCDTLTLYYIKEPGAGTFKIQTSTSGGAFADEAGFTSIDASNASKALGIVKITKTLDLYRMQVVGLTGTVRFILAGFEALTISGVVSIGLDRGGIALSSMNLCEPQIASALYADMNPDVGWFEMKEPISGFETELNTHGSRWLTACPYMDWLYIVTPPVFAGESGMVEQNTIMVSWCQRNGYQVIDSYGDCGSFAVLNSVPCEVFKSVTSITRSGGTATVTCTAHALAGVDGNSSGWVLIAGADQTEYNGLHFATVTGANTFTFTDFTGTPATPATGTISMAPTFGGDGTHLHSNTYEYLATQTAFRVPWLLNALTVWKDDPAQGQDPLAIRTPMGTGRLALAAGRNILQNPTLGPAQGAPSNFSHWQFGTFDGSATGAMMLMLRSWAGSAQNFFTYRFRTIGIGGGQNALSLGYNFTAAAAGSETFTENITFAPAALHIGQRTITNAESGLHIRGDSVNTGRNGITVYKGSDGTTVLFSVGNSGETTFIKAPVFGQQSLSGAGSVDIINATTLWTTTGTNAGTLGNGAPGQRKTIVMVVDGGDGTLTPSTKTGYSSIVFTAVGNAVTLEYVTTRGWMIVSNYGCTINP
jgi:hypothetical protein